MQPIEDVIAALNAAERSRPEPVVATELTDGEILRCFKIGTPCYNKAAWQRELDGARAAIAADRARYGRFTIAPIPVSERPWEREGFCDAEGRFWQSAHAVGGHFWNLWSRQKWLPGTGYCLPHWALPIPTTDNIQ
jgi:hypothetical protein